MSFRTLPSTSHSAIWNLNLSQAPTVCCANTLSAMAVPTPMPQPVDAPLRDPADQQLKNLHVVSCWSAEQDGQQMLDKFKQMNNIQFMNEAQSIF